MDTSYENDHDDDENDDGVVEDGTPLHAILFLVYKQPGNWIVRPENFLKKTEWNALCFDLTKHNVSFGLTFKEANGAVNQSLVCESPTRWKILLTYIRF